MPLPPPPPQADINIALKIVPRIVAFISCSVRRWAASTVITSDERNLAYLVPVFWFNAALERARGSARLRGVL